MTQQRSPDERSDIRGFPGETRPAFSLRSSAGYDTATSEMSCNGLAA